MEGKKDKKTNAGYLTIGKFAEAVNMKVSALKYYDKNGIFKPIERGSGFENKYRYYSPTQITAVKMIQILADIGIPRKRIRELMKNRSPEIMIKLLHEYKEKVGYEKRFFNEVELVISAFFDSLFAAMSVTETEMYVSEMPEKHIVLGDFNNFGENESFYAELNRFYNAPSEPKIVKSFPVGGFWDSMAKFVSKPSQPMKFFSLDPNGNGLWRAGWYLNGYTRGYYGQTNDLPERMTSYAKDEGLLFTGPVYNVYLSDEFSEPNPNNYLLQVSASVTETQRSDSRRLNRQWHT